MAAWAREDVGGDGPDGVLTGPERLGPYRLIHQIGEGGMGVVHLGLDRTGRAVAVKVLRAHIAHDTAARKRLARELDTLSRVRDPGVAALVDADLDGDRPYLVTQYVPGPSLEDVVRDGGALRGDALLAVGQGLAGALNAIHAAGVVHRDLKPGNVLLLDGRPIVIDFGIAHVADDVRLTMTGLVMGTPGYLSPEVVEGEPVTEATDWWGWAATLAFAAAGSPPFGRGPMNVVLDRVRGGRADLSGVDRRLAPLLQAALSPEPARRPAASEVVTALQHYARGGAATLAVPHATRELRRPGVLQTALIRPVAPSAGSGYPQQHSREAPAVPDPTEWPAPSATPPLPAVHADTRIGRPARAGTLGALLLLMVGVATQWPAIAVALVVLWCLVARCADRSVTSLVLRRHEHGPRRSDVPVAVLVAPWHLLSAAVATVLGLLLPLVVAVAAASCAALVMTALNHGAAAGPLTSVTTAAGVLGGALMAWWGPGGAALRRGSRSLVRGCVRGDLARKVVVVGCVLLAVGLVGWTLLRPGEPNWWPWHPWQPWRQWQSVIAVGQSWQGTVSSRPSLVAEGSRRPG